MAITFRVDDVAKSTSAPPTRSLREHLGAVMAFGGDGERRVLSGPSANLHPLLGAVHLAFAEHRPLVLSPDAVWLTILAGVTHHVRRNAENLRHRLVQHHEKKRLDVVIGVSLREHPAAIREVVAKFRDLLAAEIGQGTARLEWHLRPANTRVLIELLEQRFYREPAKRLVDLADGSFLAYAAEHTATGRGHCVVRIHERDVQRKAVGTGADEVTGLDRPRRDPTQVPHFETRLARTKIPIVAHSLTEVFERALACDGKLELTPLGFLSWG